MRTILHVTTLALVIAVQAWAQSPGQGVLDAKHAKPEQSAETISSLDGPDPVKDKELLPAGLIKFAEVDSTQVFGIYQELSGRSVIRAGNLPAAKISFTNQTPLNRREALQALDTVMAQCGITMIPLGTKYVKAVPAAQASSEAAPLVDLSRGQLPESSSYLTYIVRVKNLEPNSVVPILSPLSKLPNSIITAPSSGLIILRDYSANVRRMLQVLDQLEVAVEK